MPLIQPQFPEEQVLFIEAYFGWFVRCYRHAFAMPAWLGKPYERYLDWCVTGKHVPYKFLVALHDRYAHVRNKLKDFLVNRMPKLYMKLRMLKHKKRADKNAK